MKEWQAVVTWWNAETGQPDARYQDGITTQEQAAEIARAMLADIQGQGLEVIHCGIHHRV
jgi:hypothetical protein